MDPATVCGVLPKCSPRSTLSPNAPAGEADRAIPMSNVPPPGPIDRARDHRRIHRPDAQSRVASHRGLARTGRVRPTCRHAAADQPLYPASPLAPRGAGGSPIGGGPGFRDADRHRSAQSSFASIFQAPSNPCPLPTMPDISSSISVHTKTIASPQLSSQQCPKKLLAHCTRVRDTPTFWATCEIDNPIAYHRQHGLIPLPGHG